MQIKKLGVKLAVPVVLVTSGRRNSWTEAHPSGGANLQTTAFQGVGHVGKISNVYVGDKRMACYLDGCTLICKGDQVVADLCDMYGLDLATRDSNGEITGKHCDFDDCDLKCDGTTVRSFCEGAGRRLKGSRRLSMPNLTAHVRRLGATRHLESTGFSLWPQGQICYKISADVDEQVVRGAIAHWTANTKLTFHECPAVDQAGECCAPCGEYVYFVKSSGCWSSVGRDEGKCQEGGQLLSVGTECDQGQIIHEIGHAVGLIHEHVRPDRDTYVKVFQKNILPEHLPDFEKETAPDALLTGYGTYVCCCRLCGCCCGKLTLVCVCVLWLVGAWAWAWAGGGCRLQLDHALWSVHVQRQRQGHARAARRDRQDRLQHRDRPADRAQRR